MDGTTQPRNSWDRAAESLGNSVELQHVNLQVPDQLLATAFYISALGLTRDPYLMTGIDNMWANAGISGGLVPIAEQTVEHWQEVLRINLIGPFLAIKHSMPHMIKQKYGSIVCTASVAGLKSAASGHPYGASKAGVISLVQTTAYSLSGTGVRINAVCPGLIETGMTKPVFDRAKEAIMAKVYENEAAVAALAVTRGSRLGDAASASNAPDLDQARRDREARGSQAAE